MGWINPYVAPSTDVTGRGDDGGIVLQLGGGYWVRTEPEFRATYFDWLIRLDLTPSKNANTREAGQFDK